ncbi:MAG TPA: hypothetical protein VHH33_05490 [Nitrososphaeraceae archaeon]|jgi:cytoskeletal protein RodZ|nr:hypothetical protein [Nitrososphaeraceae archaeon]
MISVRMSFFIILIAFVFVMIPSFAVISSSQSNNTLSNNTLSNASISDESDEDTPFFENETSFASLSRSLAETNQSEGEPIPPPPPSESEDEADGEEAND